MSDIAQKTCVPCQGGIPPMKQEEIKKHMPEVPSWELEEGKLVRRFKFKDFKEAIAFINRVADLAEQEQHHPNINLWGWNKVKITYYTHKINGLHQNDFIMAAKINATL
ncbi:4a-hydroxytetrahydrobiopterin dehydratase [Candidatus Gottesmanbacteria bacterium]|nr:4a-hydroxytetrahydrobiopterin dehydratase [Candidatus Gottesmanbacteria bacterium]